MRRRLYNCYLVRHHPRLVFALAIFAVLCVDVALVPKMRDVAAWMMRGLHQTVAQQSAWPKQVTKR